MGLLREMQAERLRYAALPGLCDFVGVSCNWSAMRAKSGKDDARILRIAWPR
jgi:hypothetical protein